MYWHMQIMENEAMRKLAEGRSEEILLIEHRRAHNICIELAGVRMPFTAIKARPMDPYASSAGYLTAPQCSECKHSLLRALAVDAAAEVMRCRAAAGAPATMVCKPQVQPCIMERSR